MNLTLAPLRLATGAFILNSGWGKRSLPVEAAAGMQEMAANGLPFVKQVSPATFGRALSAGEIALGAALVTPFVPATVAGAGLTAFGGGLLQMYLNTPGMTEEGSRVRPSQDGIAIAKDVWLVGAGVTMVLSGLASRRAARRG
jgi:hypothetical protein